MRPRKSTTVLGTMYRNVQIQMTTPLPLSTSLRRPMSESLPIIGRLMKEVTLYTPISTPTKLSPRPRLTR